MASGMIVKIGVDTSAFDKGMATFTKGLSKVSKSMESVGEGLSKAITVPVAGMAAAAVKMGSDFEAQMSKIKAVSGDTAAQMQKIKDAVTQVGMTTKYSSTQAAEAMTELLQTGIDTDTALASLKPTLDMASNGQLDLGEAAGIAARELNEFEMKGNTAAETAKNMAKVSDILAYAGNHSAGGMKALSEAIVPVGGIAHTAGMSYEDLVSSLSKLSKAGYEGREGGQLMVGVIRAMSAPSKKAADEQKKLGVAFFDSTGKMRPMADILSDLHGKLDKYNQAQQMQILKTAFTSQGMRALIPLMRDGGKSVGEMSSALDKNSGYADKAAKTMNNNLQGAIATLKSRFDTVAVSLYTNMGPSLTKLVNALTQVVTWFGKLSPEQQKQIMIWAGIAAAIGPALVIFAKTIETALSVYKAFQNLKKGIELLRGGFIAMKAAMSLTFNPAAILPALGWIAIIIAVAFAVYEIIKHWGAISKFFEGLWKDITSATSKAWDSIGKYFSDLWKSISNGATKAWNGVGKFFSDSWKSISDSASKIWNGIIDFFKKWGLDILAVITGPIGILALLIYKNWDAIKNAAITAWNAITSFLSSVWNAIIDVATPIWNGLVSVLSAVWNVIKTVIMAVWNYIWQYLVALWTAFLYFATPVFNQLVAFFTKVWNTIKNDAITIWNSVVSTLTTVWNDIIKVSMAVWNPIASFFVALWNGIQTVSTAIWLTLASFYNATWNAIKSSAIAVWNALSSFFTALWNSIKSIATSVWNAISSFFTSTWNSIKSTASSVWNSIVSAVSGPINQMKATATSLLNSLKSTISSIWSSIKSEATSMWSGIVSSVSSAVDRMKSAIGSAFNGLKSIAVGAWDGIKSGIRSAINGIISMINHFIDGFNSPAKALNNIPGVHAPMIGHIPALATGGTIMGSGMALVGEAGPELISKSGSSVKVTPLSSSEKARGVGGALGAGGSGGISIDGTIEVPVVLDGRTIAKVVAPFMDKSLRDRSSSLSRAKGGSK